MTPAEIKALVDLLDRKIESATMFGPFMVSMTGKEAEQIATALRSFMDGGWRCVPVEPKPEMLAAFWRQKNTGSQEPGETGEDRSDYAAYRAMIAASPLPTPPAVEGEAGE